MLGHPSFVERAAKGQLPAVSWIDPNFVDLTFGPAGSNDDHLRNSEIYDYAVAGCTTHRERASISLGTDGEPGGLFSERPSGTIRLFGFTVDRDHGLALVYSAALGGWTYLVVWGALRAAHIAHARVVGVAVGLIAGLFVLAELARIHPRSAPK